MTFGLKSLLAAMGVAGLALYLLVAAPEAVATVALTVVWVLASALFTAGAVYGHGPSRAFCLGALIPTGGTVVALVLLLFAWMLAGPWETGNIRELVVYLDRMAFTMRVWSAGGGLLTVLTGAVAASARRLFTQEASQEE